MLAKSIDRYTCTPNIVHTQEHLPSDRELQALRNGEVRSTIHTSVGIN